MRASERAALRFGTSRAAGGEGKREIEPTACALSLVALVTAMNCSPAWVRLVEVAGIVLAGANNNRQQLGSAVYRERRRRWEVSVVTV